MGECTALVRLAYTVSGMQSSRCGHGWRIAHAAAVYLAAVLLAQANITKQPVSRPEAGDVTGNVMARAIMMRLETHKACDARAGDPGRSHHADSSSGKSRKCSMHRQLHKLLRSRQCARTRVVRGWNCGQGGPVNERG